MAIVLPITIIFLIVTVLVIVVAIVVFVVLKKYGTGTYSPQQAEIDHGLKLREIKGKESKEELVAKQWPQDKSIHYM